MNTPPCYDISTLPVLLIFNLTYLQTWNVALYVCVCVYVLNTEQRTADKDCCVGLVFERKFLTVTK